MNLQSLILLALVIGLFLFVAYRHFRKKKGKGRNCGGSCCNCG